MSGDERPAPGPIRERTAGPIDIADPSPRETQQCFADLSREQVRFKPLPNRDYGGGCAVTGAVQLLDIGVPVSNLKAVRCPLARTFTGWLRGDVAPAARDMLGSDVVRVESFGSYSCRGIVGGSRESAARVSEHGLANAVDVAGFVLADGRRIMVLGGWTSPDPRVRDFLQSVHASACRRFRTVLSPDYNAAHRNHLHLDMGRGPFCA